jgi:CubicO group peptidase (beta-lactamase class C family)
MDGMNTNALLLLVVLGTLPLDVARAQAAGSPAERQFRAWLAAFNGGDRAVLLNFLENEYAAGAGPNQQFQPVAEGDGSYHFLARHSRKCVEVPGASMADGVQLQQRTCDGTAAQSFQLTPTGLPAPSAAAGITNNGSYKVVNKNSGKCVEAAAAGTANGTPVRQSACNGTRAQVWQLVATHGGYYKVQAAGNGSQGWDVTGGPDATADGTTIQLWRNAADVDGMLGFRRMTGGFELKKAEASTPTQLTGLVQERDSDQFARFEVEVEPAEPYRITRLDLRPAPRPTEFAIPRMTESELAAASRAKLEADTAADKFAGAVMVARNGETIFSGAYGLADRDKKIPNTLSTRFRIGSMNKMFTATAVLQLVQAGKIKLEDPLGKYLPDYPNPAIATKVTIHQLLTHTGGTGDFFGPEFDAHRLELRTLQDYVKLFGTRGPAFEPGSKWAYSNYGMLLLGVIIERVSGASYYDYVRENIYRPAGMAGTGSQAEDEVVPDRSIGYMKRDGVWKANTDTLPYRGTSAGGGYSTVEDLARFASALMAHKLLNARYTELLTTGKVDTGGGGKYAYGFDETVAQGIRSFGHGGGAPGMNGDLRIYPQSGYVIAVLSNLDPPAASRLSQFISNRLPLGQ